MVLKRVLKKGKECPLPELLSNKALEFLYQVNPLVSLAISYSCLSVPSASLSFFTGSHNQYTHEEYG